MHCCGSAFDNPMFVRLALTAILLSLACASRSYASTSLCEIVRTDFRILRSAVNIYQAAHERPSVSLDVLAAAGVLDSTALVDPWGNPYIAVWTGDDPAVFVPLVTAGIEVNPEECIVWLQ